MKKIFGIALMIAVMAAGFTANAQTANTPKKERTEQCDRKEGKKEHHNRKDNKGGKEFKGNKAGQHKNHHKGQRPDLFAGITLSQDQQSKLEALKAESKAQRMALKEDKANVSKENRQARHTAFNAKVKEILTPEQWTVYEQNVSKMKANRKQKKG